MIPGLTKISFNPFQLQTGHWPFLWPLFILSFYNSQLVLVLKPGILAYFFFFFFFFFPQFLKKWYSLRDFSQFTVPNCHRDFFPNNFYYFLLLDFLFLSLVNEFLFNMNSLGLDLMRNLNGIQKKWNNKKREVKMY